MSAPDKLKVFISYSRADEKFADELVAGLEFRDEFAVTIDRHSIVEGEDWKKRLGALIADADTVVFVLSPDSAKSKTCAWEVEESHRLSKRILPILARPLGGLPAPILLAALNYVRFDEDRSFMGGLTALVRALKTDVDWLREHTRLLTLAMSWEAAGRASNRLLSGNDIAAAKEWLARRPKDAPEATALHLDFLRASEQAESERISADRKQLAEMAAAQSQRAAALQEREAAVKRLQVWTRRGIAAAAGGALGGAGLGYWGYDAERRVREEQENARRAAAKALDEALDKEASRKDIEGQLVAYAAAPGQWAADGQPGGHSPFSEAMLRELSNPLSSFQSAFSRANQSIYRATGQRQRPYISSDLNGDVYLHRQPGSRARFAISISVDDLGPLKERFQLDNVARDADAWHALFEGTGFRSVRLRNPDEAQVMQTLKSLLPTAKERRGNAADNLLHRTGLRPAAPDLSNAVANTLLAVFFAGFGFSVNGVDFLAMRDTRIPLNSTASGDPSISLRAMIEGIRETYAASILVLDTNFLPMSTNTR